MEFLSLKEWHNTVHFPHSQGIAFAKDNLFNELFCGLQCLCA